MKTAKWILLIMGCFLSLSLFTSCEKEDNVIDDNTEVNGNTPNDSEKQYINGHEYVDLGLSVMWATCNVGATSAEGYGDYFAWGETMAKETYTWENSLTHDVRLGDIVANKQYDAAQANWGGAWRMPSQAELNELKEKCNWKWVSQNGHNGYLVTGPSGKSIFLPVAGYREDDQLLNDEWGGYYWSSTPCEDERYAHRLYFNETEVHVDNYTRSNGYSVRAVSE